MKNLTKLLLPLTLSTVLNFNSKAQDFLPGKFKNYQSNPKDTLLRKNSSNLTFKISTQNVYYDLDKDSVFDVVEIFLRDQKDGRISKNPFFYILNFNRLNFPSFSM